MSRAAAYGAAALALFLAGLWWLAWALTHLTGWAAPPFAFTGWTVALAGVGVCVVKMLEALNDR